MKIAVQSPSSPTKLELFCQDEWPKIAASLCAELVELQLKDLPIWRQQQMVLPSIDTGGIRLVITCAFHKRLHFLPLCDTKQIIILTIHSTFHLLLIQR